MYGALPPSIGKYDLSHSIRGHFLISGGRLDRDMKMPTRLVFYSLTEINAATDMRRP